MGCGSDDVWVVSFGHKTMAFSHKSVLWKVVLVFAVMAVGVARGSSEGVDAHNELKEASGLHGRVTSRFLTEHADAVTGRKLMDVNLCGRGSAPDYSCKTIFPGYNNATCCSTALGVSTCIDVGADSNVHCGSCSKRCAFGLNCCDGVCVDRQSDRNNCGACGSKCSNNLPCRRGLCGYNGRWRPG